MAASSSATLFLVGTQNGPKYLRNIFSSFFVFRQNDPNFWKKIEKMFRPKKNFEPRWPPRVTPAARPVPSRRWCKCSRAIKCLAGSHNVQRNLPRLISEKLCLTQRASMKERERERERERKNWKEIKRARRRQESEKTRIKRQRSIEKCREILRPRIW